MSSSIKSIIAHKTAATETTAASMIFSATVSGIVSPERSLTEKFDNNLQKLFYCFKYYS
ncbi:MAG: hypothetical protein J6C96_04065 [Oscillospiraceae bacterium]|nr:hypothetical protein [Oscillospiraceae bacterium]